MGGSASYTAVEPPILVDFTLVFPFRNNHFSITGLLCDHTIPVYLVAPDPGRDDTAMEGSALMGESVQLALGEAVSSGEGPACIHIRQVEIRV